MDMLLTGRNVPAEEAKSMGLVSHVVKGDPKEEALDLKLLVADSPCLLQPSAEGVSPAQRVGFGPVERSD